jgi:hypothetical protein
MAIDIGRRHFMSAVGGAVAWPLAVRAQSEHMRRVGDACEPPVPVENSDSAIMVVQPAQNRNGNDVTVRLHSPRVRRILAQG